MKKFRKIMAVLVAAMMIMATMVPAFADFILTYDANGGTNPPSAVSTAGAVTVTSEKPTAPASDVKFIGWTESAKPILAANDTRPTYYKANDIFTIYEAETLYALWGYDYNHNGTADILDDGDAIQIKYEGNSATGGEVPGSYWTKPNAIKIGSETPERTGHKFLGWVTNTAPAAITETEDASGFTIYNPEQESVTVLDSTTFYALWAVDANNSKEADYTETPRHNLSYNMNKSVNLHGETRTLTYTGSAPVTTNELKNTVVKLAEPAVKTATCYDEVQDILVNLAFIGWSEVQDPTIYDSGATTFSVKKQVTMGNTDKTMYAVWGYTDDGTNPNVDLDHAKISANNDTTKGTAEPETHNAWKIFDVTKSAAQKNWVQNQSNIGVYDPNETGFAYTIDESSDWFNVIWDKASGAGKTVDGVQQTWVTLTKSAVAGTWTVEWTGGTDATDAKAFAAWLYKANGGRTPTIAADGTFSTEEILYTEPGYYLIDSTLGTALVLATSNVEIKTKNEYIASTKLVTSKSVQVGNTATYYIVVEIPATIDPNTPIVVHDKMDKELLLISDSIKVAKTTTAPTQTVAGLANLGYGDLDTTITKVPSHSDGCTFELSIDPKTYAGTKRWLVFKYDAELLSDADADHAYKNTAYCTYSHYTTKEVDVDVQTYDFDFNKVDENGAALEGAVFQLFADNNGVRGDALNFVVDTYYTDDTYTTAYGGTLTSYYKGAGGKVVNSKRVAKLADKNVAGTERTTAYDTTTDIVAGDIAVSGLGAGTYYLVEKQAPNGYNLMTDYFTIEVTDGGAFTIKKGGTNVPITATAPDFVIENTTSAALPSTGGMGTTVLYIVGGMMVILAGAYLFFSKRRNAA